MPSTSPRFVVQDNPVWTLNNHDDVEEGRQMGSSGALVYNDFFKLDTCSDSKRWNLSAEATVG